MTITKSMSSLTNAELIFLFFAAQRETTKRARTRSGSLWFDGGMLFSYDTQIGLLSGKNIFYLVPKKYSLTTTKHQMMAAKHARSVGREVKPAVDDTELRRLAETEARS